MPFVSWRRVSAFVPALIVETLRSIESAMMVFDAPARVKVGAPLFIAKPKDVAPLADPVMENTPVPVVRRVFEPTTRTP